MDKRDQLRLNIRTRLESNGVYLPDSTINQCVDEACKLYTDKRSLKQNAYLFGVPYKLISEYTGYTTSEVHHEMCLMFHFEFKSRFDGSMVQTPKTTTSMSKKEFTQYWEKIQIYAAENWDLYIPSPNEELMISAELQKQKEKA